MTPTRSAARRGIARARPAGATAWMLRAPTALYALGLGWVLGRRFAEITHRGRRSGLVHRSVVEVARFDPHTQEVVVASAWHGRTDWYRNIQANPALQIQVGRARFVPEQRMLTADETVREMGAYLRRHPVALRLLPSLFGIDATGSDAASRGEIGDFFRGVVFRPRRP